MDERIITAIDYIKENLDKKISLKVLSEIACLSPIHFHRIFKKTLYVTPKKFVELHKIECGYKWITQTDMPIRDVSLKFGFQDYETFSRLFKKYYNISPNDLRIVILRISHDLDLNKSQIIPVISNQMSNKENFNKIKNILSETEISEDKQCNVKVSVAICQKNNNLHQLKNRNKKYAITYNAIAARYLQHRIKGIMV